MIVYLQLEGDFIMKNHIKVEPRVLLGCPIHISKDYCIKDWIKHIMELNYENYDIMLVDNTKDVEWHMKISEYVSNLKKEGKDKRKFIMGRLDDHSEDIRQRIVYCRNRIRDMVLQENYDYFFSLECDVFPEKDVIQRMIKHDKDVVTGVYLSAYGLPIIFWDKNNPNGKGVPVAGYELYQCREEDLPKNELIKIDYSGVGCLLIKRETLLNVSFRVEKGNISCDDMFFGHDLMLKDLELWCDTGLKCRHDTKPWHEPTIKVQ